MLSLPFWPLVARKLTPARSAHVHTHQLHPVQPGKDDKISPQGFGTATLAWALELSMATCRAERLASKSKG